MIGRLALISVIVCILVGCSESPYIGKISFTETNDVIGNSHLTLEIRPLSE